MFNIDLQHLKVIRAIKKEGSMKLAAETLHLSQSALSHHITQLEKNIGLNVFERRNKKLWITEAGSKMLESSELIINELVKLDNDLNTLKNGESGVIRISTECYTTYSWLPKLTRNFNKIYPHVQVQIVVEATRKPINYLQNGQLDIAIVSRKPQLPSLLKYSTLFKDELVVVLHKENPLAKRKSINPVDLREQSLIVYDTDDKDIDLLQLVLKPKNIEPLQIIKMQLTEVIIEMIKSNFGIAILARWLVEPLISDEIILLPFNDAFAKRTWQLVTHPQISVLQKTFIDFAINELNQV